jgi:hypothetical protein
LGLLLFVPIADILELPCPQFRHFGLFMPNGFAGAGLAAMFAVLAVLAFLVSHGRGRQALGAAVVVPSLAAIVFAGPSWYNFLSLFAGFSILAWTERFTEIAVGIAVSCWRVFSACFLLPGYITRTLRSTDNLKSLGLGAVEKGASSAVRAVALVWPAALATLVFLILLSLSNDVLAQWVGQALTKIWDTFAALIKIDATRVFSWFLLTLIGTLVLLPAWRSFQEPPSETLGKNRRDEPQELVNRTWQWGLLLGGVNLAFLLTNTLDVVWLWVRRSVPNGVSSTEYLHHGVYGLIIVTILAGVVLAWLFNEAPKLTRSPWLRWLSLLWVAQNLFLIAGVGFRLWLHVESFCLTPRRIGVAFFLALVLVGFALLVIYILRQKTLRWLVVSNLFAVLTLFFGLQFANIDAWCADSAIRSRKANPNMPPINASFISKIGNEGWRVVHFLATSDEATRRAPVSSKTKDTGNKNGNVAVAVVATGLPDDVIHARHAWNDLLADAERAGAKMSATEKDKWNVLFEEAQKTGKMTAVPSVVFSEKLESPTWHSYVWRRNTGNAELAAALKLEGDERSYCDTLLWWGRVSSRHYPYSRKNRE